MREDPERTSGFECLGTTGLDSGSTLKWGTTSQSQQSRSLRKELTQSNGGMG